MKMIKPYTPRWEKEANGLARDYCPPILACKKCGHPVIDGYRCDTCGTSEPYKGKGE